MYGIHNVETLWWCHFIGDTKYTDRAGTSDEARWDSVSCAWYKSGRPFAALDTIEGRPNAIFHRLVSHSGEPAYWQAMGPVGADFQRITIPVLSITGYFDDDQRGALHFYAEHLAHNPTADHTVLIGPYDHGGSQDHPSPQVMGYAIDSVAKINIMDITFQWFDHILKGARRPSLLKDRINFEVMGANLWRHVPSMQGASNDTITFALSPGAAHNEYALVPTADALPGVVTSVRDLTDRGECELDLPVMTGDGGAIVDTVLRSPYMIRFTSAPLSRSYDLNGSFAVHLRFVPHVRDLNLAIGLYEQTPDNKYVQLSRNIVRCSYVMGHLDSGAVATLNFDRTYFTSRRLARGSRMILLVGPLLHPKWATNYGRGEAPEEESMRAGDPPTRVDWLLKESTVSLPVW